MNLKIKYRESFRPFAPSVLMEEVERYFELDRPSPYMLLVAYVDEQIRRRMTDEEDRLWGIDKLNVARSEIPAITHVDYSARIQTVHKETNPLYHEAIRAFQEKTGCPVIVNTSFNVRGEPIVMSPEHAYLCFMRTEMDYLALTVPSGQKKQPALRMIRTEGIQSRTIRPRSRMPCPCQGILGPSGRHAVSALSSGEGL
jgi:carbamoyltransferase